MQQKDKMLFITGTVSYKTSTMYCRVVKRYQNVHRYFPSYQFINLKLTQMGATMLITI